MVILCPHGVTNCIGLSMLLSAPLSIAISADRSVAADRPMYIITSQRTTHQQLCNVDVVATIMVSTIKWRRCRCADRSIVFTRWRHYASSSDTSFPGRARVCPRLHLDRFIHFCRTHPCAKHTKTDTQTTSLHL